MKLRAARHTADLERISSFYQYYLGLQVVNSFTNHDGYDGIMLGFKDLPWELEFTASGDLPDHKPDPDDLLVFYPSIRQLNEIMEKLKDTNTPTLANKNPYWTKNGLTIKDPDGYLVVLVKPELFSGNLDKTCI